MTNADSDKEAKQVETEDTPEVIERFSLLLVEWQFRGLNHECLLEKG